MIFLRPYRLPSDGGPRAQQNIAFGLALQLGLNVNIN